MRDFIEELKCMCSSSNEKSRGFYIGITAMLIIIAVLSVVLFGLNIFMLIKGWWKVTYLLLLIVAVAIEAGVIFYLKKS